MSMYMCFLGRNITTRILGLPQLIATDQRSDKKFRQIFLLQQGGERKQAVGNLTGVVHAEDMHSILLLLPTP